MERATDSWTSPRENKHLNVFISGCAWKCHLKKLRIWIFEKSHASENFANWISSRGTFATCWKYFQTYHDRSRHSELEHIRFPSNDSVDKSSKESFLREDYVVASHLRAVIVASLLECASGNCRRKRKRKKALLSLIITSRVKFKPSWQANAWICGNFSSWKWRSAEEKSENLWSSRGLDTSELRPARNDFYRCIQWREIYSIILSGLWDHQESCSV